MENKYTDEEIMTAENLVNSFSISLMLTEKELSNEVIDSLSIRLAIKEVKDIILCNPHSNPFNTDVHSTMDFWLKVKEYLENYKQN